MPMKEKFGAILFDNDGILVDTERDFGFRRLRGRAGSVGIDA